MVFQNLVFLDSKQTNLNTMGYKCIFPISPIFSKIHIRDMMNYTIVLSLSFINV